MLFQWNTGIFPGKSFNKISVYQILHLQYAIPKILPDCVVVVVGPKAEAKRGLAAADTPDVLVVVVPPKLNPVKAVVALVVAVPPKPNPVDAVPALVVVTPPKPKPVEAVVTFVVAAAVPVVPVPPKLKPAGAVALVPSLNGATVAVDVVVPEEK